MLPQDLDETSPGADRPASLEASLQLIFGCITQHVVVPAATTRDYHYQLAAHAQSGPSTLRNFKVKLYQHIGGLSGNVYPPGPKIDCIHDAATIDHARKHIRLCSQPALEHKLDIYHWCARNFHHEKVEPNLSAHEQASDLSWRKYQHFRALNFKERSYSQGQMSSPVLKIDQPYEGSQPIASSSSSSASNVVIASEVDSALITGRIAQRGSGSGWLDSAFDLPQPPKFRSLPVDKRSLLASQTFPESATSTEVPRLNNAAHYPSGSVQAKSTPLISNPQAIIILAFCFLTLSTLVVVVFCHFRGRIKPAGKVSIAHPELSNQPPPYSYAMGESSHRVTIKPEPSPVFLSGTAERDMRGDRSQPTQCQFGTLHPGQIFIESETLGDITLPKRDILQGEHKLDNQQQKNFTLHTILPRYRIVSLTASLSTLPSSPTAIEHQSVEEKTLPSELECIEATPQGKLACPIECSPTSSGKSRTTYFNGIHHPLNLRSSERDNMEHESCEIQVNSISTRERSATTAPSMQRRSSAVADKLSSILIRPMTSFSDSKSKPLPVRRLKTSYGVGDDFDSDEEQVDQAALSRILRTQNAGWPAGQLARVDAGLETDNYSLSVGFRSIEQRRSTMFSRMKSAPFRSAKRRSFGSMNGLQGIRPSSQFSYINSPSPYDTTFGPTSPASSYLMMHEQDHNLSNTPSHSPNQNNVFFANPPNPKLKSRSSSVSLAPEAPFCSSPKSLSAQRIPLPADMTCEKTCGDLPDLGGRQQPQPVSSNQAAHKKQHRHSKSAPMNIFRESTIDLEPIQEIRLGVTNPDIESDESEIQRKQLSDPAQTQELSDSPRTISASQLPPLVSESTSTVHYETNLETIPTNQIEVLDHQQISTSTNQASPNAEDSEILSTESSPKQSKRRSWLSSSLSLRILPQNSSSKKSTTLNMSPARLRKSLSIGGKISSEMKAGLHPLDLNSISNDHHHHHHLSPSSPSRRAYHACSQDSPSSVSRDISSQPAVELQTSPTKQHQDFNHKNSNSSLNTLFGFFTKSKKSANLLHQEYLSSPSPTSEFASSSSCSTYYGNLSLESHATDATTINLHSPISPVSSAPSPYPWDDTNGTNSVCEGAEHQAARIRWKSRLNSVGSFIDDFETSHPQTPQSGLFDLVIANPDMSRSSETVVYKH
ncbi:hypothetical protein PSTG_06528 [Puccinia striiformis f. sp. tritici PST-78]|uniref:Uncharacterized protein n=1 Tax=Puccinia striiformis f. sp. tritici PST-78 TaxID=1165861 RepID=A0A0L0VMB4_9BASI|nr:hypothetical protein PSTG_06528 [Puccinia striiformis f. sp. tritici PST-78]